jgi:hypothetical protein
MAGSVLVALVTIAALGPATACAIAGGTQELTPSRAQADMVLEGVVEVIVEDSVSGSRTLYFLISDDRRIQLRLSVHPPNLTSGTRVRVVGRYDEDGTFVVSTLEKLSEG